MPLQIELSYSFKVAIVFQNVDIYSWPSFYRWTLGCSQFFMITNNSRMKISVYTFLGMHISVYLYNNYNFRSKVEIFNILVGKLSF